MAYNINDAFLAQKVYDVSDKNIGTIYKSPDGSLWKLEAAQSYSDGYQGALFKNQATGQYEFASRGTQVELSAELHRDLLVADLQMGFKAIPDQMVSQREFFNLAKGQVIKDGGDPNQIILTGHSLGGSLVNLLGAENPQNKVQGFNAYGVGNLVPDGDYSNITNHVMARDPVSVMPGSNMLGTTYKYNEPTNPSGDDSTSIFSHFVNRFLWDSTKNQAGTQVKIDVYTPLNWAPADGGGIQGDPFTGMPWPTANDVTASGNGYNFPNTAGAGRGVVNPELVKVPDGLGSLSRNSANYITDANANDHLAVIKAGGTLSDLWVLQKSSANGFADAKEFYAAVLASNPGITDVNKIPAGTSIYLPEKFKDGSITYNYANGVSINSNAVNGEYHLVVPDGSGGNIVYSRTADEFGYTVREVHTDKVGAVTLDYTGTQATLDAEIKPVGFEWNNSQESGKVQVFANSSSITSVEDKATGDITETVKDSQQNVVESKTYDNHAARVEAAQQNALLAGVELFDAIRHKNNLGAISAITRLVNESRIAADQPIVFSPQVARFWA
jgi:hypothetical protein